MGAKSPTAGVQTALRKVDRLDCLAARAVRGRQWWGVKPPRALQDLGTLPSDTVPDSPEQPGVIRAASIESIRPSSRPRQGDSSEVFIGDEDVSDDSLSPSECGEKLDGLCLNGRAVRDVGSWGLQVQFRQPLESLMVALQYIVHPPNHPTVAVFPSLISTPAEHHQKSTLPTSR